MDSKKPLAVRRVPIESLVPDPANARVHDERNLDSIEASLKKFGQVEPLVVRAGTNVVIGGNGRLEAMRSLGWTECDVAEFELTDDEARALGIALNRTAELAAWDLEGLAASLDSLKDIPDLLASTGFDSTDLTNMLAAPGWPEPDRGDPGEHDPEHDTFVVKVEGVRPSDKDDVVDRINRALEGTGYESAAY